MNKAGQSINEQLMLRPQQPARKAAGADRSDSIAAPQYSEIAIAEALAASHSSAWRYCTERSEWMVWNGCAWEKDTACAVRAEIRRAVKREANKLAREKSSGESPEIIHRQARRLATNQTITGVERILQSHESLTISIKAFDADIWALNTPDGTIDLRSGSVRAHRPLDFHSKQTGVSAGGDCPRWYQFLAETFGNGPDMLTYVQRAVGYMLTGETREHAFWFAYGGGGNGKSVFFDTLRWILGDYACVASADTFMADKHVQHPTDLARLAGARLVLANETEEGMRWAEAKLKQVTGGDQITARFMRQDSFEFKPQFKLVFIGNHLPSLRNVDTAMRRRIHILPFLRQPSAPDQHLPDKLRGEAAGILQWAIEGCLDWQHKGLQRPTAVLAATQDYLDQEDAVARWLSECVDVSSRHHEVVGTQELFESWVAWACAYSEPARSLKWLSSALSSKEFVKDQNPVNRRTGFSGLKLRVPPP